VKKYILFDHDGVLVDTELWYFKAGERALADIGVAVDRGQYLRDMTQGLGTWAQAEAAGVDERPSTGSATFVTRTTRSTCGRRPLRLMASSKLSPS
jgi:beta-phosphoglucomutase-like phosphatase (HAD superfamily)